MGKQQQLWSAPAHSTAAASVSECWECGMEEAVRAKGEWGGIAKAGKVMQKD